ncbi:MAG: aminotransferase class I/II-fold pyridoxal phosphate-dependent enzyme [Pseudomonadota bacterium]
MQPSTNESPSARAMARYLEQSPGLRRPLRAVPVPGLPTLPDLKKLARDRRAAGQPVVDQSAGDIDDVGQALDPGFVAWIEQARADLVAAGHSVFRVTHGDAYGFPANYQQQYPVVVEQLARSWGIQSTPYKAVQTVSGRTAIDQVLRGMLERARAGRGAANPAIIVDTLAWSGYQPLAEDLGLAIVHMPAVPAHGLSSSAEGLAEAIVFCREQQLQPVAAIPIVPSNPTGVGISAEKLKAFVETAAAADLPVLVDAFYSPLAPEGHAQAVPLAWLEQNLAPEALAFLGVLVGETKVTSSQNKTSTVIWMAPPGHDDVARRIIGVMLRRLTSTNTYPRPQEALVAYALHSFAGGIHAAMGPRYRALDAARQAMRETCDSLGLPLSIGGSFYGTVALVDAEGQGLIRDIHGTPLTDPRQICELLIREHGLVGAPGGMFSSAPEAAAMARLTAAVTLDDVKRVRHIFEQLLHKAGVRG